MKLVQFWTIWNYLMHFLARLTLIVLVLLALLPLSVFAKTETTPAAAAEALRTALLQAQLALPSDPARQQQQMIVATTAFETILAPAFRMAATEVLRNNRQALQEALAITDPIQFATLRARIWTAVLAGSYQVVEHALANDDPQTAQAWLPVREFRHATRFSRPGADATLAVASFARKQLSAQDAIRAVRAELLDTYQARLNESLHDLLLVDVQGFAMRRAEEAALAEGYFTLLIPAFAEQRGATIAEGLQASFVSLRQAAVQGKPIDEILTAIEDELSGFRAAPLSPSEQVRRAGQMARFLSLVPVEYGRAIRGGKVAVDLEIREAITFRAGAATAFADLQPLLAATHPAQTAQAAEFFRTLETHLSAAEAGVDVPTPATVQATTNQLTGLLSGIMPPAWQARDNAADFDVIGTALDQMEAAVVAGEYNLAESTRLEAYAILESGPEARLIVFAPAFKPRLENLFWYGQEGEHKGLAYLIDQKAPVQAIRASRKALSIELNAAQKALTSSSTPGAATTNAAVIVFREGLEAVLILASLMGSMKAATTRRLRRPMWWGVGWAGVASIATWWVAQQVIGSLARYGEKLEAVVSVVAIAILLLITNWFFHQTYWTDHMASLHTKKRGLIGTAASQWLGLAALGFTSVYREGFETVLFLQALVLESGILAVLEGVALGLAATLLIGFILFKFQLRLPYKKMLIFTGILIGVVLLTMVGNTVHIMQVVGWMPLHPIRWLTLPYWTGMWFGLYASWEGIALQAVSGIFVIGSYFLAERLKHASAEPKKAALTIVPSKPTPSELAPG